MARGHGGGAGGNEDEPGALKDTVREAPLNTGERDPMTYNRMEAKPIAGEHGRFCGDAEAPLVKTPCCQQWICGDTAFVSLRGGGRCQVEHERLSLCYSHEQDQHGGPWESCQQCRDFWSPRDEKFYAENPINRPRY